jgi:methionyl-tRNA formyltransferase
VPSLEAIQRDGHEVSLVVTQPDRPAHRRRLTAPPVKEAAQRLRLPVYQPERLRDADAVERIRAAAPELIVVVAYGQILPSSVLEIPPRGVLNVHASLLPRWRGAAPIAHAILAGDEVTGVTIMKMDDQLDHGPVLATREVAIRSEEDAAQLSERLAQVGADLLVEAIAQLGDIDPVEQEHAQATLAPRLKKEDGDLDWTLAADEIVRRLRAFTPWPGVTLPWRGGRIKVLKARSIPGTAPPGEIVGADRGSLKVGTGQGILVLMEVQLPTRRPMPARNLVQGVA